LGTFTEWDFKFSNKFKDWLDLVKGWDKVEDNFSVVFLVAMEWATTFFEEVVGGITCFCFEAFSLRHKKWFCRNELSKSIP
jgi:hypothetical protein